MKNEYKTIGLVSTMSPDDTWSQQVLDRVSANHVVVKAALQKMGFEVLDEGPMHRSYQQMLAAGRSLRAKGIRALVIYVGTWAFSNCAAAAALEANVPVLILPDAEPGTCGLVGGAVVRGAMAELGQFAQMIYGKLDNSDTQARVKSFLDAACAAIGLRGQVLGVGGGRSMGMLTAVCDPNEVRKKFGVEIDSFEQMEIIDRAEKISDAQAGAFLDWMKKTFGKVLAKEAVVYRQIKLYLALKEFVSQKGYDFVAVKCLPELPVLYTTFCLAHALMGDAQDNLGPKDRFVFACEADINAALTMQILKLLAGGPILFTDTSEYNWSSDILTTCNCGSQPTDFARNKKDVYWEREGIHEFQWKYGGTCPQHVAHAGRATTARLSRDSGRYQMLIAPVDVVEMPRETLKQTIWERPHTFLKLLCDREAFFDSVRSNHLHLAYGNWAAELEQIGKMLGIESVVVK